MPASRADVGLTTRTAFVAALTASLVLAAGAASASARSEFHPWPRSFKRAFVQSCTITSGGNATLCVCAMHKLQRRYTVRQIISVYEHHPRRFNRIVRAVLLSCM